MTIIVVPETGKRTVTFRFSWVWIVPVLILLVGLSATVYVQWGQNRSFANRVAELDTLRRTNRLQEAEIETLQNKVVETDQKLAELQALENQLREMIGQPIPSRGGNTGPVHSTGRGGAPETNAVFTNIPTLGAMLPPEVRSHLFARRDTLPMHLQVPEAQTEQPATAVTTQQVQARLENQLSQMERLTVGLSDGKAALKEHLDHLAHRPNGLPVSGGVFTDRFGWRWSPFGWGRQWHDGLDIAHDYWEPVVATADGVVSHSGWLAGGYGYTVMIDHGYGYVTMYAHLSETKPDLWQEVRRGDVIGWVGNTGNSTGPHVHYEVHVNGTPVDPVKYLQ